MHSFSDSSDVLALVERIKFNIEIQQVFFELYACASAGQKERQRWAGEERLWEGKQTEERPGKISVKTSLQLFLNSKKKGHYTHPSLEARRFSLGVLAVWMCFKNVLSYILINNWIICCNDHLKMSSVQFILLPPASFSPRSILGSIWQKLP